MSPLDADGQVLRLSSIPVSLQCYLGQTPWEIASELEISRQRVYWEARRRTLPVRKLGRIGMQRSFQEGLGRGRIDLRHSADPTGSSEIGMTFRDVPG